MVQIAIYDLDRTIVSRPTFTPFLIFSARRLAPLRLALLPIWVLAMLGYKLKLYGRKPMKQFGIALFIGLEISNNKAQILAEEFSSQLVPSGVQAGAARQIALDRAGDCELFIATAAPEFYAREIGLRLGFDGVIATRHQRTADGGYYNLFADENCYGAHKLNRVKACLADQGIDRSDCIITFYTDHPSDAPMLDWADKGVIINGNAALVKLAQARGWSTQDWR